MLKRNARATKAKRPMTAFGRFILPLAAVMAIALFFFSAKLFFLTSNERDYYVENSTEKLPVLSSKITEDEPIADVKAAAIAEKKDMPVINITKKIDQAPVKKKKEEQKIIAVTKKTQTTEENKINKKQDNRQIQVRCDYQRQCAPTSQNLSLLFQARPSSFDTPPKPRARCAKKSRFVGA